MTGSARQDSPASIISQIEHLLATPEIVSQFPVLSKLIVSNNGSTLDERTFPSEVLDHLIARTKDCFPNLKVCTLEARCRDANINNLGRIADALSSGKSPMVPELAIGVEVHDERIRNNVFRKGLTYSELDRLCGDLVRFGFRLKCYFMLKPVPQMTDVEAVRDIHLAIERLSKYARDYQLKINLHLNPTYVAFGTPLEQSFIMGRYSPPQLRDLARAAVYAENRGISVFLGLCEEQRSCKGGTFMRDGDEVLVKELEAFNRTQDFDLLRRLLANTPA